MNRNVLGLIVVAALGAGTYFLSEYLRTRDSNTHVAKNNDILTKMEQQGIPAFTLPHIDGSLFSSQQMQGKLIFINFWASWCDPCVREFPSMLSLVKHFKGDLIMVAISNDENKDDMMNFVKAFEGNIEGVHFLWDPERKVTREFGTEKLPETYMVGPDLKLIRKIVAVETWYTPSSIEYMADVIASYKKK